MQVLLGTCRSQLYLHSFVEVLKLWNLSNIPPIATRDIARRFITVPVNCTQCVADCNHNYTVYSECTCNGRWIFRKSSTKAATSSTVSHSCDVTPYKKVFFIRNCNFASLLTQQQFTATVLLLLIELTKRRTKCTVQQPLTLPTDSVQWEVQWTLSDVGATDWMVAVHNTVMLLVVCG